ncbi:MAG: ROK family transcriptional regulator [Burkholderiales bacterium]|nr:ROK family transcriptional regulator [Anaerolineae bacterium]
MSKLPSLSGQPTAQETQYRTGDQALVREINLSLIMNRLREHAPISRAALAEITGLNKSTVSSLINELIDHQFVREVGLSSAGIGRPSMQLQLNPQAGFIVSGEIGIGFVSVVCANFAAEVIWRYKAKVQPESSQQETIDQALALLRQAIAVGREKCEGCDRLLGVALAVPGLVDQSDGMLLFAPNLSWENVPLKAILKEAFPEVPVFVENEANMAALGEYFFGAAQGYDEVLYISAGVGLGGALVRGGQVVRGKTGFASEFGHMTMYPDGERCNCGNVGCWETCVSQSVVFRQVRRAIDEGKPSVLCGMVDNDLDRLTVSLIVDAAQLGDQVALQALEEVGHHLGVGIASLVNALNPDLVLFGGILSVAGNFLLPIVELELQQRALRWNANAAKVALARHGFYASVVGGVAMVYQTILSQPSNAASVI